jgi:hypothetical protein
MLPLEERGALPVEGNSSSWFGLGCTGEEACEVPTPTATVVRTHSIRDKLWRQKERKTDHKVINCLPHHCFNGPFKMRLQFTKHSSNLHLITTTEEILKFTIDLPVIYLCFHKINQISLNEFPQLYLHVKSSVLLANETMSNQTELWKCMTSIQKLIALRCWSKLKFCEQTH